MGRNREDLSGKQFGDLLVIEYHGTVGIFPAWDCICRCGSPRVVLGLNLRNGNTKGCGHGCAIKPRKNKQYEQTFCRLNKQEHHGMSRTSFYSIWNSMKQRCRNINSPDYRYYGGRGICIEWLSFEEFKADMYASYVEHKATHSSTTIEREDNDGNYNRTNCKWATRAEQNQSKRNPIKRDNKGKFCKLE